MDWNMEEGGEIVKCWAVRCEPSGGAAQYQASGGLAAVHAFW